MLLINAQSQQQGVEGDLHDPRGGKSIARLSMGHSHHVHALGQPLEQSRNGIAHHSLHHVLELRRRSQEKGKMSDIGQMAVQPSLRPIRAKI